MPPLGESPSTEPGTRVLLQDARCDKGAGVALNRASQEQCPSVIDMAAATLLQICASHGPVTSSQQALDRSQGYNELKTAVSTQQIRQLCLHSARQAINPQA